MSYTDRFAANVSFFAGVVAERCASVGGAGVNADSAGADELSAESARRRTVCIQISTKSSQRARHLPGLGPA